MKLGIFLGKIRCSIPLSKGFGRLGRGFSSTYLPKSTRFPSSAPALFGVHNDGHTLINQSLA